MAYTARDEVQALMAHFPLSGNSHPTQEQADVIIEQISAEIDGYIQPYADVPVESPAYFISWLATVNAWGATASVLKSMFPATTGQGENPAWSFWEKKYQAALKTLQDGSGIPDVLKGAGIGRLRPSTYLTRNPSTEETLGDIAEPFFKRGQPF